MASVVASEIIVYGAVNQAEADGVTQGGAIDTTVKYIFDDADNVNDPGPGIIGVKSDSSSDTSITMYVTGRNIGGSIVIDPLILLGTADVSGAITFERILKIDLSGIPAHTGTITVTGVAGIAIASLETTVNKVLRPFYNVSADSGGGSERVFYEKAFIKNTNTTNSLLSAAVVETADPSGVMNFGLANAVNEVETISTRLDTSPTGTGSDGFTDSSQNVPGADLASLDAIGVWMRMTLPAGSNATKTTWTLQTSGNTT